MTNHSISTDRVFALCQSQSQFPIDFDDAWQWVGYSRKDSAKRALLSCGFEEGIDIHINVGLGTLDSPKTDECIMLTVDCFKMWAMMAGTEKGRETRIYFLECERKLKDANWISLSRPKSLLDLSRTQLYSLAAHKLSIEFGTTQNPELIEDIDAVYLTATSDAAYYAYHLRAAEMAVQKKLADDVLRDIGWIQRIEKEINEQQKEIERAKKYAAQLGKGSYGKECKADFDRFESAQSKQFESNYIVLKQLESCYSEEAS